MTRSLLNIPLTSCELEEGSGVSELLLFQTELGAWRYFMILMSAISLSDDSGFTSSASVESVLSPVHVSHV